MCLLSVPHPRRLSPPNLLLQLKDAVEQRLSRWRAPGDVNVNGNDPVDAPDDAVAVVVVPSSIGAAAHADDPFGVGHLVVALADGGGHLVADGAGDDHDVGLARGGPEDDAQAVLVVSRHGRVHHLDAAAGEGKGERPHGAVSRPRHELVDCGSAFRIG